MDRYASCVHALTGRLRIKLPELKGNPVRAQEIENQFILMTGMQEVSANPVTGSLLCIYDPNLLKQEDLFALIKEWGSFREYSGRPVLFSNSTADSHGIVEKVATSLVSGLMEVALTRLVSVIM